MGHWQLLQLEPHADERSIKRAYARLLKVHRPDEDAAAFQRLREAYDEALAQARRRAECDADEYAAEQPGADAEAVTPLLATPATAPAAELTPPAITAEQPLAAALITPAPFEFSPSASAPDISLAQMRQWLAEGQERQVFEALQLWLASDWLLPFDRRQQFEQDLLEWLEAAEQWSPAFFDRVAQAMGWDEARGVLPCNHQRWAALMHRCEASAWTDTLQRELQHIDPKRPRELAVAFLLKPMDDARRRSLADHFISEDWQACEELHGTLAFQHPEIPQRLGLDVMYGWRCWLPHRMGGELYVYLWLLLTLAWAVAGALAPAGGKDQALTVGSVALDALFLVPLLLWIGTGAYRIWLPCAVAASGLDIRISQTLLPARCYRYGTGLLVLRHVLPCAGAALLMGLRATHSPWVQWPGVLLVFAIGLYLCDRMLRDNLPAPWSGPLVAVAQFVLRPATPWQRVMRRGAMMVAGFTILGLILHSLSS